MSEHLICPLRPAEQSLHEFRAKVRDFVRPGLSLDVCDDLLLALGEMVTNAIVYGGGSRVIVHIGLHQDRVTATVRDGGQGFDVQRMVEAWPPRVDAEGGRGIYVTAQVMDSVAIHAAGGTVVHMSRALTEDYDRSGPRCVWCSPPVARFAHGR